MTLQAPSFDPVINALQQLLVTQRANLGAEAEETLREVIRRLERLSVLADELMVINNKLMGTGMSIEFDSATDSLVVKAGDAEQKIRLRRADPGVPITMRMLTEGAAYRAGAAEKDVLATDQKLRLELESKVEAYYQSAHRVLKLLGSVAGLPTIKCMPITQVRNKLIEHPDSGAIYSFGFGTTGPRVKPMHRGKPVWNDEGLIPNTRDFVNAIVAGCART